MCLGHTHAIGGAATAAAAAEFSLHLPATGALALAGLTAAFATLPDLDTKGSCAARALGWLSEAFGWLVERVSGGHRHGTHSVLGVAVFTTATWLACIYRHDLASRVALAVFLTLAIAAGLRALRLHGGLADAGGAAAAAAIAFAGPGLALVPVACGLGCAAHIAADMLTTAGCPLAWPLTLRHFGLPRPLAFVTGTWRETCLVVPVLLISLGWSFGWLAWHAMAGMR
jgi:membrane-bound metal-dependent hydrolase YbcI (DUF457 family)